MTGLPWDKGVNITPLPDKTKYLQLSEYMKDALDRGAVLANPKQGGQSVGSLFFPAVLSKVSLKSKVAHEEQFGPIVPVREWAEPEEVRHPWAWHKYPPFIMLYK